MNIAMSGGTGRISARGIAATVLAAAGVAACGSSSSSSQPSSSSAASAATTATTSATVTSTTTTTTTSSSTAAAPLATAVKTGSTSLGTVVTDPSGMTLYHLTPEKGTHVMCTGGCASTWPPLTASGSLTKPADLTGTLGTVVRPDGTTQLTYNGWPLYRYSGDSAPGQVNGQGIAGVWFAVTPGLAA